MNKQLAYRADIDGLRTIAVLSVIAYHLGLDSFSGGFVGVDIFFVISGFLIGKILISEMSQNSFSFQRFYLRRVKRLFPAFFATVIASLMAGYFIFLPSDFKQFAQSAFASSVYLSNVLFFMEADYFDKASELKPLLHTWSLAVEEQFYIVFPLLLFAIFRYIKSVKTALFVLLFSSFLAAIWMMQSNQPAAFFLLPFRAWELLLGVVLATGVVPLIQNKICRELLSGLGFLLMILPVLWYDHSTFFPGWSALPPCLGAALYIYCGQRAGIENSPLPIVNAVFSARPFVLVGLASYSLYLWHWPIIVFSRYAYWLEDSPLDLTILTLLIFVVGFLSWKYIEQPGRRWLNRFSGFQVLVQTAVISLLVVIVGLMVHFQEGMPKRLSAQVLALSEAGEDFHQNWDHCFEENNPVIPQVGGCFIGDMSVDKRTIDTLVWGDSHARAFKDGLNMSAKEKGVLALFTWQAGCPPLFGLTKDELKLSAVVDERCSLHSLAMQDYLLGAPRSNIKKILLIGRWSYYLQGGGVGVDEDVKITLSPRVLGEAQDLSQRELFLRYFQNTVKILKDNGYQVTVLQQVPEIDNFKAREMAVKAMIGRGSDKVSAVRQLVSLENVERRQGDINQLLGRLASGGDIALIKTHATFCDASDCSAVDSLGYPRFVDNNHVTVNTSLKMQQLFGVFW